MTLTGTLEEQIRAIDLILSKLFEDPHYSQTMNAPFSYAGLSFIISLSFMLLFLYQLILACPIIWTKTWTDLPSLALTCLMIRKFKGFF